MLQKEKSNIFVFQYVKLHIQILISHE